MPLFFLANFNDTNSLATYTCDIGGPFRAPSVDLGDFGTTPLGLTWTELDGNYMRFDNVGSNVHILGITTAPPQKNYFFETMVRINPALHFIRFWIVLRAKVMSPPGWTNAYTGYGAIINFDGAGTLYVSRVSTTTPTPGSGVVTVDQVRAYGGLINAEQSFKFRVEVVDQKRRIYVNDFLVGEDYIREPEANVVGDIIFFVENGDNAAVPLEAAFDYMAAGTDLLDGTRTGIFWRDFVKTQELELDF